MVSRLSSAFTNLNTMKHTQQPNITDLIAQLQSKPISASLKILTDLFPDKVTFSTSFSFEDQVVTHEIATSGYPVSIFTLDTGRLFSETYSVWNSTIERYQIPIQAYYPPTGLLEEFVSEKGPNSFYQSVENRKQCCHIRKVIPLKRALEGKKVWITGLRAEHSTARQDLPLIEWDPVNEIIKYNPVLHWSSADIREHIRHHNIPYNPLHDKGFVSIGCAPCTRAIRDGEDFRAGRWWWEESNKKECGLHEK